MESVIAQQLEQFTKAKNSSRRFQPVNNDERQQFGRLGQEVQTHRQQRQQLEAKAVDPTATPSVPRGLSARVKLPKSPFVAKQPDQFGESQRPPQTHAVPQLDPQSRRQPSPRTGRNPETRRVGVEPKAASKVERKPASPKTETPKAAPPKASPPKASPPKAAPPQGKPQGKPQGNSKGNSKGKP